MPCGAFSGFCNVPTLFTDMSESLVAVLGYPHREHKKDSYKHVYLMCQPANGEVNVHEMNRSEILSLLRANKNEPTYLPQWIEHVDNERINRLSEILKMWLKAQIPQETQTEVHSLLRGNKNKINNDGETIEHKFRLENFDLIAWEYLSTNDL